MTVRKKVDATLFELCLGIFLYGVIFECVLLCFSRNASYSIGLWCGVIAAIAGSIHMWVTLDRSMELIQKSATAKVATNYIVSAIGCSNRGACGYGDWKSDLCFSGIYGHEIIGVFKSADKKAECPLF